MSFVQYINGLEIETIDFKHKNITQFQQKSIQESAWVQLLMTLQFWLNDSSVAFEKTDIFIEKSVNTSFDIMATTPLSARVIELAGATKNPVFEAELSFKNATGNGVFGWGTIDIMYRVTPFSF